jgi:hypothetical protein
MKKSGFYRAILLFFLLVIANKSQAQQSFNSAEEKIVYNKNNGLYKYEGILIEYSYALNNSGKIAESDLQKIKEIFPSALKFRLESENGQSLLYILTEGDRKNHDRYNEALAKFPELIEKGKRNYLLK